MTVYRPGELMPAGWNAKQHSEALQLLGLSAGRGIRLSRHSRGITISLVRQPAAEAETFWAMIDGSSEVTAGGNRWRYTWTAAEFPTPGAVSRISGGVTSAELGDAYDAVEFGNTASGTLGIGVEVSNLAGTGFSLRPVPDDALVLMRPLVAADGSPFCLFSRGAHLDGACLP
ncbi:MAG: hypothetical protein AAGB51_06280 [Planctomycetota bacterium]